MSTDIREEWFGIVNGEVSLAELHCMALGWIQVFVSSQYLDNQLIEFDQTL